MPHRPVESNPPFNDRQDSQHGPSRGEIAFRLESLEKGQDSIHQEIKGILVAIAKVPSGACPRSEQCQEMWGEVEQLKLDKAKQDGAMLGGKAVLVALGATVGALVSMVGTYISWKGK